MEHARDSALRVLGDRAVVCIELEYAVALEFGLAREHAFAEDPQAGERTVEFDRAALARLRSRGIAGVDPHELGLREM